MADDVLNITAHLFLLLAMPPLMVGVINKVKAFFAGRVGPPVLQPYYDLIRLMRKGMVISTATTWVFQAGPLVTLVAIFLAGLMMPMGSVPSPVQFTGDLVLFAYLLALGRFFTSSAALDTGSPFEGMGASREVTFGCLSEPALFLAFLGLVRFSGSLSLTPMLHAPLSHGLDTLPIAPFLLIAAGLFVILLAENSRIPVDDPDTHLELTMIHEVMVLDHSGPLFGAVLYGASMKLFVISALLLHVIVPFEPLRYLNWPLFVLGILLVSVVIGVVESVMARLQMRHVPTLLISAGLLCGFGFLLMLRSA